MIRVGINENVFLKGAALTEKQDRLDISWGEVADKPYNAFEALQADEVVEKEGSTETKLFAPKLGDKAMEKTEEKREELVLGDINATKAILQHIMKVYMTIDQMPKLGSVAYNGLNIDKDNFGRQIQKPEILAGIFKNMCNAFINAMKPFMNRQDLKMRLLLVRQSKEKHFAVLRNRYLDENPFLESMEVPVAASKLKFTKYELANGLDDGTPTARTTADKPVDANGAPVEITQTDVDAVFGQS